MVSKRREENQSMDSFSKNYTDSRRSNGSAPKDREVPEAHRITVYGKISADAARLEMFRRLFAKGDYKEILVMAGKRIKGNLEEEASSVLVTKAAGIIKDIDGYNIDLSPQLLESLKRPIGEIYRMAQMCREDITRFCRGYEPGEE